MAAAAMAQMPPGPGVDLQGRAVIDPTVNVKEKLEDTVRRLDDLNNLREEHRKEIESQRRHYDSLLREAERGRREAEKDRLDAIRIIDVTAVAARATEANERASQLAQQVQATAEANRVQVAAAATAFRAELVSTIEPIQKRLEELSKVQYEQQGQKAQVVEARESAGDLQPILNAIAAQNEVIASLTRTQQQNAGGVSQQADSRDSTRLYVTLFGAAIVGLTFYNSIKGG